MNSPDQNLLAQQVERTDLVKEYRAALAKFEAAAQDLAEKWEAIEYVGCLVGCEYYPFQASLDDVRSSISDFREHLKITYEGVLVP